MEYEIEDVLWDMNGIYAKLKNVEFIVKVDSNLLKGIKINGLVFRKRTRHHLVSDTEHNRELKKKYDSKEILSKI